MLTLTDLGRSLTSIPFASLVWTQHAPHAVKQNYRIEVVGCQIKIPEKALREFVQESLVKCIRAATYTACIDITECHVSKMLCLA